MRFKVRVFFNRVDNKVRHLSIYHTDSLQGGKDYIQKILDEYGSRIVLYYQLDTETNLLVSQYEYKEEESEFMDYGF